MASRAPRPVDRHLDLAVWVGAESGLGGEGLLAEPLADVEVTAVPGVVGGDGEPHRVVGVVVSAGQGEYRLGGQGEGHLRLRRDERDVAQDREGEVDVAGVEGPLHRPRRVVLFGCQPPEALEGVADEPGREQRGEQRGVAPGVAVAQLGGLAVRRRGAPRRTGGSSRAAGSGSRPRGPRRPRASARRVWRCSSHTTPTSTGSPAHTVLGLLQRAPACEHASRANRRCWASVSSS